MAVLAAAMTEVRVTKTSQDTVKDRRKMSVSLGEASTLHVVMFPSRRKYDLTNEQAGYQFCDEPRQKAGGQIPSLAVQCEHVQAEHASVNGTSERQQVTIYWYCHSWVAGQW